MTQTAQATEQDPDRPWLWNVVLLDSDDHTYEYVIEMLRSVFAHPVEKAFQLARTVDEVGKAVLMTTHRELAELKQEQVHSFGKDERIMGCKGSMYAMLEPASAPEPSPSDS